MIEIASPLVGKVDLAGEQVKLSELRTGLLHIRGKAAEQVLNAAAMAVGDVLKTDEGLLVRLRRDEFVLLTEEVNAATERIAQQIGDQHVTLTDITHGRGGMTLSGKRVNDVLAKVCALDFGKFVNYHAAQSSLAKVRALIIRHDGGDLPTHHIIVDRSMAAYVWDVVWDAAQEFAHA